jgi:transcription-repair coupling factor (superfamily II helicase)
MAGHELSVRMDEFTHGEIDILLSISIIESGLDIPSANTLIVDRADTFGLAQLYQLRGRVGRGAQRAYAYFFRHNRKQPTLDGRQRLETIAENTQLGAGFSIAMRDLEIRGAGDILGTRQHGQIAAVGFHLYTRLLASAVRRLRSERGLKSTATVETLEGPLMAVTVELPIPVSLPPDYIPDKTIRLGLYRRMATLQTNAEVDALEAEFRDRFGDPPEIVRNLFYQLKIKLLADQAGLASISSENNQLVLRYPEGELPERLPELGQAVRQGKTALWMPMNTLPDWPARLYEVVERLAAHRSAYQLQPG